MGSLSTNGDQMNLNEYPRAAQEKYVTAERATPASLSHSDSEEKIRRMGSPAENPKNNMVIDLLSRKTFMESIHDLLAISVTLPSLVNS